MGTIDTHTAKMSPLRSSASTSPCSKSATMLNTLSGSQLPANTTAMATSSRVVLRLRRASLRRLRSRCGVAGDDSTTAPNPDRSREVSVDRVKS